MSFTQTGFAADAAVAAPVPALANAQTLMEQIETQIQMQSQVGHLDQLSPDVVASAAQLKTALQQYEDLNAHKQDVPPEQLAAAWAAAMFLVYDKHAGDNRWPSANGRKADEEQQAHVALLFSQMPAPALWPYLTHAFTQLIAAQAATKKDATAGDSYVDVLPLLAAVLNDDTPTLKRMCLQQHLLQENVLEKKAINKDGKKDAKKDGRLKTKDTDYLRVEIQDALLQVLIRNESDPQALEELLDFYIQSLKDNPEREQYIEMPDLSLVLGDKKARAMALRLLQINAEGLSFAGESDNPFVAVCADVLRQHRADIAMPHWTLLETLGDTATFEASEKTEHVIANSMPASPLDGEAGDGSAADERSNDERDKAYQAYILSLIGEGKAEQAQQLLAQALTSNGELRNYEWYDFVDNAEKHNLLEPSLSVLQVVLQRVAQDTQAQSIGTESLWDAYKEIANRLHKSAVVRQQLHELAAKDSGRFTRIHLLYAQALLAHDQAAEACTVLDRGLTLPSQDSKLRQEFLRLLLRLEQRYPEKGYLDYILNAATNVVAANDAWFWQQLFNRSLAEKKYTQMQDLAKNYLVREIVGDKKSHSQRSASVCAYALSILCRIFIENNQLDQAVSLAKHAAWWSAASAQRSAFNASSTTILRPRDWYQIIRGIASPEKAKAYSILMLYKQPNDKARYTTYLAAEADSKRADEELQALAKVYPQVTQVIEQRMQIALHAGDFLRALQVGEHYIGTDVAGTPVIRSRYRNLYPLLAQASAGLAGHDKNNHTDNHTDKHGHKQSYHEKKKFYTTAVAVLQINRKAETAAWNHHYTEAIALYQQALALPQASKIYCLQLGLACSLAELDNWDDATESNESTESTDAIMYYRNALDLLLANPQLLEERRGGIAIIFEHKRVQDLAQAQLQQAIENDPRNARAYYLSACLLEQQAQFNQAGIMYRKAIACDPHYAPAYKKILRIASQAQVGVPELERLRLQLLHLEPSQKIHQYLSFDTHLAAVWNELAAQEQITWPTLPPDMFPLASASPRSYQASNNAADKRHNAEPATIIWRNAILSKIKRLACR